MKRKFRKINESMDSFDELLEAIKNSDPWDLAKEIESFMTALCVEINDDRGVRKSIYEYVSDSKIKSALLNTYINQARIIDE